MKSTFDLTTGRFFESPEAFEKAMAPMIAEREENTRKKIQRFENKQKKAMLRKPNKYEKL